VMIPIEALAPEDVALVGRCLEAAANGPFFPDWEFDTLFGLSRDQLRKVAGAWPQNATEPDTEIAVRSTFANLSGYPHHEPRLLEEVLSTSTERLQELWERLNTRS
jgi:hypothetical protein